VDDFVIDIYHVVIEPVFVSNSDFLPSRDLFSTGLDYFAFDWGSRWRHRDVIGRWKYKGNVKDSGSVKKKNLGFFGRNRRCKSKRIENKNRMREATLGRLEQPWWKGGPISTHEAHFLLPFSRSRSLAAGMLTLKREARFLAKSCRWLRSCMFWPA